MKNKPWIALSIFIGLLFISTPIWADDPNSPVTKSGDWIVKYLLAVALPFLTIEFMAGVILVKLGKREFNEVIKIVGYSALFAAGPAIMGAIWQVAHG